MPITVTTRPAWWALHALPHRFAYTWEWMLCIQPGRTISRLWTGSPSVLTLEYIAFTYSSVSVSLPAMASAVRRTGPGSPRASRTRRAAWRTQTQSGQYGRAGEAGHDQGPHRADLLMQSITLGKSKSEQLHAAVTADQCAGSLPGIDMILKLAGIPGGFKDSSDSPQRPRVTVGGLVRARLDRQAHSGPQDRILQNTGGVMMADINQSLEPELRDRTAAICSETC